MDSVLPEWIDDDVLDELRLYYAPDPDEFVETPGIRVRRSPLKSPKPITADEDYEATIVSGDNDGDLRIVWMSGDPKRGNLWSIDLPVTTILDAVSWSLKSANERSRRNVLRKRISEIVKQKALNSGVRLSMSKRRFYVEKLLGKCDQRFRGKNIARLPASKGSK
jgi:hypothetical protein